MSPTTPRSNYVTEFADICDIVHDKWLLWDASAIIKVLEFEAEGLFVTLADVVSEHVYIEPTYIELQRSDRPEDRGVRQAFIEEQGFVEIPLQSKHLKLASKLQDLLHAFNCHPEPVDLFLGGELSSFHHNHIVLITGNMRHFPEPMFSKEGYILVQNSSQIQVLSIVSFNHGLLAKFES